MSRAGGLVRRAAMGLALLTAGAMAGFAAALLRRRPLTSYSTSLRQPAADSRPAEGR